MLLNWTFWNFGVSLADFLSAPRWTDIQLQLSHSRPLIATIEGQGKPLSYLFTIV